MSDDNYTSNEISDGQPIETRLVGGQQFRVVGYVFVDGQKRCPTEKCGAYCCKTGAIFADTPPPCPLLTKHLSCSVQDRGGTGAKPFGCVQYPRSQADIDAMNKNAVGDARCHLRFEAV